MNDFEKRLKELRKKYGFSSRKKLALKVNSPEGTIKNMESGQCKNINVQLIISLSHLYNVSADYILTGKEFDKGPELEPEERLRLLEASRKLFEEIRLLFEENRIMRVLLDAPIKKKD